jgi:hypothetical protein
VYILVKDNEIRHDMKEKKKLSGIIIIPLEKETVFVIKTF